MLIPAKSPFTVGDVVSWFPYDTKAMSLTLTGRSVVRLLDAMVRSYSLTNGGTPTFPHVSTSLSFTVNCLRSPF
jgi:2',3'-cyclic-nucleotide 2'-phosphodiesterase (5'-nucleotidase family)